MSKDALRFTVLFFIILVVDIIGLVWFPAIRVASKPLIVTSLLGFYILKERESAQHKQHHLFLTALIFALLGDIFLNIQMEGMFVIGLFSFLITQVLYSSVFFEDRRKTLSWTILLALLIFSFSFNYLLWEYTEGMQWQVVTYSLFLSLMVFTAFSRKPSITGYRYVVMGAVLFLISDSLLAVHKFYAPHIWLAAIVMATYGAGQYCIVVGYKMKKGLNPRRQ